MGVGSEDGNHYESQFDLSIGKPLEVDQPTSSDNKRTSDAPKGSQGPSVRASTNIEDDRNKPHTIEELSDMAQGSVRHIFDPFMWAGRTLNKAIDNAENFSQRVTDAVTNASMPSEDMSKAKLSDHLEERMNTASSLAMMSGTMAGVKASTANLEAGKEWVSMMRNGATPEEAWKKTGWFLGEDLRPRFEIPNTEAKINPDALQTNSKMAVRVKDGETYKLGDFLDHPELYKAYPHLKDIDVKQLDFMEQLAGTRGWYHSGRNEIALGNRNSPEEMKSTLLHEIQHAIQNHEGFARGGNLSMFNNPDVGQIVNDRPMLEDQLKDRIKEAFNWDDRKADAIVQLYKDKHISPDGLSKMKRDIIDNLKDHPLTPELEANGRIERLLENEDVRKLNEYRKLAGEVESRNVQARLEAELQRIKNSKNVEINKADALSHRELTGDFIPYTKLDGWDKAEGGPSKDYSTFPRSTEDVTPGTQNVR